MRLSARSSHTLAGRSPAFIAAAALLCAVLHAASAAAASVAITLQLPNGAPLADAAVTVQPVGKKLPAPAPVHAVMDQMNRMFMPEVTVIPVGSTVSFPNSDSVSHQIYSFSPAKRFQLPLYRGKPYPPLLFDQTGVVILGCNIHDWMIGYIDVVDAPFYGVTDAHGSWSAELPSGRYEIKVWHPRMREESPALVRELTVDATDRAELILRLTKPLRLQPMEGQSGDTY